MSTTGVLADKTLRAAFHGGYGTIDIRVVVFDKGLAATPAPAHVELAPLDAAPEEVLPETDKRPISGFLEEPKRGKYVCVFLISGQRQHVWDNQFIVRDLDLKYLRNHMLVVVECDGLRPEAIAELMQGSRNQFFEGTVYFALEARVIATLKGDPDLRRLEEEAEEDITSLQAGDEAVQAALDQLIEEHHIAAPHTDHGLAEAGDSNRKENQRGSIEQTQDVVVDQDSGSPATEPVLQLRPDSSTIRVRPDEPRRVFVHTKTDTDWKAIASLSLTLDPPVKELLLTRKTQTTGEEIVFGFDEPTDFDEDVYPIETVFRATALFDGSAEPRLLERRLVIMPKRERLPKPPVILQDDPTFLRVTSHQPIRITLGGPDVHVKLRWDGRDELVSTVPPEWTFRVACDSPSVEPPTFLTRPVEGHFELLVQATQGLSAGEELKFDIEAIGPGKALGTAFLARVVEPAMPRKMSLKTQGGAQRRPPYKLVYIKRENWVDTNLTCFGEPWTGAHAGSFESPSAATPLVIAINQDMDLVAQYREALVDKKLSESTIQLRINKYTAHVAYHLYQMFQKAKQVQLSGDTAADPPSESSMRDEIQRVAHTLIKLMEFTQ